MDRPLVAVAPVSVLLAAVAAAPETPRPLPDLKGAWGTAFVVFAQFDEVRRSLKEGCP